MAREDLSRNVTQLQADHFRRARENEDRKFAQPQPPADDPGQPERLRKLGYSDEQIERILKIT